MMIEIQLKHPVGVRLVYCLLVVSMCLIVLQVTYFDRRREYLKFKAKMEKGFDPVVDSDDSPTS